MPAPEARPSEFASTVARGAGLSARGCFSPGASCPLCRLWPSRSLVPVPALPLAFPRFSLAVLPHGVKLMQHFPLGYFVPTRAVIFGLDGVLVTTDEMHYRAWTKGFQ